MSRNAKFQCLVWALLGWFTSVLAQDAALSHATNAEARVVVVAGDHLLNAFAPDGERVAAAFNDGLTHLTRQADVRRAWLSLVSTNDTVGIKVFAEPGEVAGVRPAVVVAMVKGLLAAGLPTDHIILWDRHAADLRDAGYYDLADQFGVRVAGAAETGYDANTFYLPDSPVIGQLVWGDLEFGKTNADHSIGKKSFVSKLVSQQMTKIISVAPLMNENAAGVCGHFLSLGLGSVDNVRRFEDAPERLAVALPEINALPSIGDRVVLYVTDALLAQYSGGPTAYLQFSSVRNELWLSHDPVALDTMAIAELKRLRTQQHVSEVPANGMIYTNAVLLQLGVNDPAHIQVETVH